MHQGLDFEIGSVMTAAVEPGTFVSLCTVQQASGTIGASGAPDGTFVNISGAVNIPCMSAPVSHARIQATEQKALEMVTGYRYYHVLLNGLYSVIPAGDDLSPRPALRCIIDGQGFEVMGVEHDSQLQMTRLEARTARI